MPPFRKTGKVYAGKSTYASGLTSMQKKQVVKIAKTAARASQEKKRIVYANAISATSCTAWVANPLYSIAQGVASGQRISNSIYLNYLTIRFRFSTNLTTNKSVVLWFFAFWSDEEIISDATPQPFVSTTVATVLPFIGSSALNYAATNVMDPMQCKPVIDKRYAIPVRVSGIPSETIHTVKLKLNNHQVKYLSDSNSYADGKNLYWGFVADAQGTTVDSTIVGTFLSTQELHFRE